LIGNVGKVFTFFKNPRQSTRRKALQVALHWILMYFSSLSFFVVVCIFL